MVDKAYLDYLRSNPANAGLSELELVRRADPTYGTASDGTTPLSDTALTRKIMGEAGLPDDEFSDFSKYVGLERSGPLDEIGAGFADGMAGMQNTAANAFPAWMGRLAQQQLSPELNEFLGTKDLVDENLAEYQKQEQLNADTSDSQAPKTLEQAKTYGDYLRYMGYATGNAAASMAEVAGETVIGAGIGAGIGALTAGPAGAVAGAVAGGAEGTAVKQGIKALLKDQVKNAVSKEVLTSEAVKKGAKYGALTGANSEMFKIQTGDYDQELLDRGIDNPLMAGGMGVVGTALEFAPEIAAFSRINKAFGSPAGQEAIAHSLISKVAGKDFLKTLGKEALTNAPAEGLTEAAQQGLIELADKYVNDANLMTPEVASRVMNSFAQGFLGSAGLTTGAAAAQTIAKFPLSTPKTAKELVDSKMGGEVSPDKVDKARAAGVVEDDGDVPTGMPQAPQPKPTTEAVSLTPVVNTPDEAKAVDDARKQVTDNLDKAQAVADNVATTETKQVNKARRQPKAPVSGFVFPKELGSPKPTVNGVAPKWNNDLEKALYIVGNPKSKSKSHDKYVEQIKKWKPEWTDADIAKYGKQVIDAAKVSAKEGTPISWKLDEPIKDTTPVMTKEDGRFVQLGDVDETSAVTRSKLVTPTKQDEINVRDKHNGVATFTLSPDKKEASVVSFSPVDPGVAASNPELAKTLSGRPFLTNTLKSLKEMGVNSVDLSSAQEINPEEVKTLIDAGVIKETNKPGVFNLVGGAIASFPKDSFNSAVNELMRRFELNGKEHVVFWNSKTGRYAEVPKSSSTKTRVTFSPTDVFRIRGVKESGVFLHNHPEISSLSMADIASGASLKGDKPSWIIAAVFNGATSAAQLNTPFLNLVEAAGFIESLYTLEKSYLAILRREIIGAGPTVLNFYNKKANVAWQELLFRELDNRGVIKYASNLEHWGHFTKTHGDVIAKITPQVEQEVDVFIKTLIIKLNKSYGTKRNKNDFEIRDRQPGKLLEDARKTLETGNGDDTGRFGRWVSNRPAEEIISSLLRSDTGRQETAGVGLSSEPLTLQLDGQESSLPFSGMEVSAVKKTPLQHEAKYQDLMRSLRDVVKQIAGDSVSVEFWDTMTAKTEDGRMRDLRGYQQRNTIAVALGINEKLGLDPFETATHEAFHSVYQLLPQSDKAIFEADRASLQKYVRRNMRSLYNTDLPTVDLNYFDAEEIGALAFGLYAKRKADGLETNQAGAFKILNKIFNFLKQMGRVISGKGYRSADHVFRDVFRGDYAENGKLAPDTVIRLQQELASTATRKAGEFSEKKFTANTNAEDIARDRSAGEYERQVSDSISRGIPPKVAREYGNMAYFFDALKSIPGIGRNNPLMASASKLLRTVFSETRAVLADFAVGTNEILSMGPNAMVASEHMDYLSENKILPSFIQDAEGNASVQYKNKEGKRITLKGDVADAYFKLNTHFKKVLRMQEALLLHDLPKDIQTLQQYTDYLAERGPDISVVEQKRVEVWGKIRAMIDSPMPYFPQMRFGEHAIKVEKTGKDGKPEMVGFYMIENDLFSATGQPNKAQEAAVRKQIEEKYGKDSQFNISNTYRLTDNDVSKLFDHSKMRTEEVISGFLGDKLADQLADDLGVPKEDLTGTVNSVRDKLLDEKAFLEKFDRKIDKMFGERQGYDGYSKDYARVIDAYFTNYPRQLIQAKHRKITNKYRIALTASQANGKVKEQINNLIDYNLNPRADWGLVRQVNFATTLGLNPASAVLQLATLATQLPATMMQWQGSPIAALATIGKATADAKRVLDIVNEHKLAGMLIGKRAGGERLANFNIAKSLLKNVLSEDEIKLVVQMYAEGDIVPVMTQQDVLGDIPTDSFANKKMYHAKQLGNSIMGVLAGPMATTEQFSRLTTVLATHRSMKGVDAAAVYNVLKDDGNFVESVHYNQVQGMPEDMAIKLAAIQNTVDNTHAVFGKFARNWNQRGFFGALPFAFMNFPIQAMEYLFHLSKRSMTKPEARMAMAYLVASMFMMGGLAGMPAWELFKSLYEKIYYMANKEKIDLDYEIRSVLSHSANLPSPLVDAISQGGLSALTGTSVGSRMSLPFFWQGLLGSALKGEVGVTDAMGVQGGLINNAVTQIGKWSKNEASFPEAALMATSPVFVRNAFEALVGWPNNGVKTGKGNVLLTPEDITVADQVKKALGFGPANVAKARQAEYVQYLKTHGTTEFKSAKTSELANLKLDIFNASKAGNTKKVESLRGEYSAKYQELLEFLRKTNDGQLSARMIDGIQSSVDQKYQSKKNPLKEVNKREQKAADEIRKTLNFLDETNDSR